MNSPGSELGSSRCEDLSKLLTFSVLGVSRCCKGIRVRMNRCNIHPRDVSDSLSPYKVQKGAFTTPFSIVAKCMQCARLLY